MNENTRKNLDATLGPALDHARRGNAGPLNRTVDFLRADGLTYTALVAEAHKARPWCDAATWEDFMRECDQLESA